MIAAEWHRPKVLRDVSQRIHVCIRWKAPNVRLVFGRMFGECVAGDTILRESSHRLDAPRSDAIPTARCDRASLFVTFSQQSRRLGLARMLGAKSNVARTTTATYMS